MKSQPLICVRDVEASSRWYCELLRGTSGHGGREYERVMAGDELVLQLHAWDVHEHPSLGDAGVSVGNGLALWFQVDDFEAAVERARALKATVIEEPHVNESAKHREIWLRDDDGYLVVLASAPGS
jgi:catechol 2,3-dioxygenase-like lactoylglutathione lyase family enzyme